MALPIIEDPIYGQMTLETSAWASTFTWVDRTADLVAGVNYALGGRVGIPGQTQTDVGTLNATFKNLATAPLVGDLVRLRRTGTTDYAFIGYVQDVSQRVVFDDSVSFSTPVVLTSINCLDWVGYISQFQVIGVGGLAVTTYAKETYYSYKSRARALNNTIDATNATQLIAFDAAAASSTVGDTDFVGTMSDQLDLVAATQNLYWHSNLVLPTNKTTGRTGLVTIRPLTTAPSSGYTFTDAVGSAGQLHYTEIDFESSSQNVANTIVINNFSVITDTNDKEVTKRGGANVPNYNVVNGVEVVSVPYDTNFSATDATSITTYGNRASEINTNLAGIVQDLNLIGNPSLEYSDEGYTTQQQRIARRKPADNSTPFAPYHGEWALRFRIAAIATTPEIRYTGSEADGVPVVAGVNYQFQAAGARGSPNRANVRGRAFIRWTDEAGATISTAYSAQTTFGSTPYVWQVMSLTSLAPAGAERATLGIEYNRADGSNFSAGDQFWGDGFLMRKSSSATAVTYFDGDNASDNSFQYIWTGELGLSPTFKVTNNLDDIASTYLTRYSTTSNRVTRIRWNAQEDMTKLALLKVGNTVNVIYDGTTTTHRIVGVDGNISPDRYMIDYYLEKV
jgi:hypothetical protein